MNWMLVVGGSVPSTFMERKTKHPLPLTPDDIVPIIPYVRSYGSHSGGCGGAGGEGGNVGGEEGGMGGCCGNSLRFLVARTCDSSRRPVEGGGGEGGVPRLSRKPELRAKAKHCVRVGV